MNMRRGRNITSDSNGSDRSNTELSNFTAGQGAPTPSSSFSSSVGDRAGRNGRGHDTWPHCTSSGGEEDGDGDEREQQQPMFDPKVIDMDATTILRYIPTSSSPTHLDTILFYNS